MQTRATPGVYTWERSFRSRTGSLFLISILPPSWAVKVRSITRRTLTPATVLMACTMAFSCSSSRALAVMSLMILPFSTRTMSTAPMSPPALLMAVAILANMPMRFSISTRMVML